MSVVLDSSAYFDGRLKSIGVSDPTSTNMRTRGIDTLAAFAFCSSYVPGASDDSDFRTGVLQALIGDDFATHADAPRLRRLFFEAHTLSVADLRRRAEPVDTDATVRMPIEERKVRMDNLRTRLVGLEIHGPLEPSHALIDNLVQQLDKGQVRYVPWVQCTMREQEVLGIKVANLESNISYAPDASGFLKGKKTEGLHTADVGNDLLFMQALQRRALAFELANICRYEVMHSLTVRLLREMQAPVLRGYRRLSMEQIENADRFVFIKLAEDCAGGLGVRPDGSWPAKDSIESTLLDPRFSFLLMQMPGNDKDHPSTKSSSSTSLPNEHKTKTIEVVKKGKKKVKGGGKSSSSDWDKSKTMNKLPNGENICFGFNLDGCKSKLRAGEKCKRGHHVCWLIGCGKAHKPADHL